MNELIEMLRKTKTDKFWGQIQIDFHAGEITLVRRTETIKLKEENTRPHEQRNR